jgi:hypothetical protein
MTDEPEKTPSEKLAEAVRRKADQAKAKGGGAPGRGSDRATPTPSSQSQQPTIPKRSGSFKGR